MNNPEEEVLSIPAANTFELVSRHGVYSCPSDRNYRDSLYVTFRSEGSIMDRLWLIETVYDRVCSIDAVQSDVTLPETHKARILAYLRDPLATKVLVELDPTRAEFGNMVRFYLLDRLRIIWLPYPAKQETPIKGHVYYSFKELLNPGTSCAVRPTSQEE